jgi:hypothetical protein
LTLEIESDELMKTSDDLEQAETKDASATEIIKQIRKVNADGTFTIGYETVSDRRGIILKTRGENFYVNNFGNEILRKIFCLII